MTLFPDVANLPSRTPVTLAKAAARQAEQWITEPSSLVLDHGMDTFVLWAGEPRQQQVAVSAHEVAPVARAPAAHGRGS